MDDRSFARSLGWASALLVLANLLAILAVFLSGYDWDLDHEFYYGSRLLEGELLWTREFHDKLPMLQMVMAIPASFEAGIQVWRGLSLGVCLLCILGLRTWIPRLLDAEPGVRGQRQRVVDFGLLFLIAMLTMRPGGFSTINPIASCLAATVMVLMLLMARPEPAPVPYRPAVFVLGGLAAALAISMRPYFLAPLAFTLLWLLAEASLAKARCRSPRSVFLQCIAWGAAIGGFGLAGNVLPYVLTGQLEALRDGLSLLAADLNPSPFLVSVVGFLWVSLRDADLLPFYILVIAFGVVVLSLPGRHRGEPVNRLLIHGLGAIVSLFAYMATKHWWNHYVHLFDAFAAYLLIVFVIQFSEGRMRASVARPLIAAAKVVLPLVAFVFLGFAGRDLVQAAHADSREHPRAVLAREVRSYLASRPPPERDFLMPLSVYVHWQLRESRHGFPHAASTGHVLSGWWRGIGEVSSFIAPHDARAYCEALMERGPGIVITFHGPRHYRLNERIRKCLSAAGSRYVLDEERPLPGGSRVAFFVRR